jgi:hypothetical protein
MQLDMARVAIILRWIEYAVQGGCDAGSVDGSVRLRYKFAMARLSTWLCLLVHPITKKSQRLWFRQP